MLLKAMEEQTDEQVEVVLESQGARKKIYFMTSVMMKAVHKLIVLKQKLMAI